MSQHAGSGRPTSHHEESDVNVRGVFGFALGLAITTILAGLVTWGVLSYLDRRESVTTTDFPLAVGETRRPPGPRLQVEPRAEMRAFALEDEAALSTYGWVDRDLGLVRVPIDVAMRLTLERGLPARTPGAAAADGTPQP